MRTRLAVPADSAAIAHIYNQGVGRLAMQALIREAENAGLWKLVSRIFIENIASRRLMLSLGFRDTVIVELLLHANLSGLSAGDDS